MSHFCRLSKNPLTNSRPFSHPFSCPAPYQSFLSIHQNHSLFACFLFVLFFYTFLFLFFTLKNGKQKSLTVPWRASLSLKRSWLHWMCKDDQIDSISAFLIIGRYNHTVLVEWMFMFLFMFLFLNLVTFFCMFHSQSLSPYVVTHLWMLWNNTIRWKNIENKKHIFFLELTFRKKIVELENRNRKYEQTLEVRHYYKLHAFLTMPLVEKHLSHWTMPRE